MFPDFLKTKEKLQKMLYYKMKAAVLSHMGPFADVPESIIFEGNKNTVVREDDSIDEENLEGITVKLEVKFDEVEKMNHEMVLDKINRAAEEMAGKLKKLSFEQIEKAAEEAGNVVSTDGKPLSVDSLSDILEKIDIDFDKTGNPNGLRLVAQPNMSSSITQVISQAETDSRYQAIIERKREEWYAREGNRKLVG